MGSRAKTGERGGEGRDVGRRRSLSPLAIFPLAVRNAIPNSLLPTKRTSGTGYYIRSQPIRTTRRFPVYLTPFSPFLTLNFLELIGIFYNAAVPLLTYLIMKGELTPQEINMNSISMFRAGVETVRC